MFGGAPVDGASQPVIEVSRLVKTYGTGDIAVYALRGVSLRIERGDYLAIMGASGSGKSTLMNIIGCLDSPTSGEYRLDGIDVSTLDEFALSVIRNRKIGFVFQSFNLIPRTPALANVELPMIYAGLAKPARRARAMAALTAVGLKDRVDHLPNQLSGGQQQRVAIARALASNPSIVLADEPTGALDSVSTSEVLDIFDAINAQGRTVIIITHEEEVARRARRQVTFRDGTILHDSAWYYA